MKSVFSRIVSSNKVSLLLNTFDIAKIPYLRSFLMFSYTIIIPRLIAFSTKTSNTILTFFVALFASLKFFCCMVGGGMFTSRSYNKIFWSIVISYPIYVMNYLCRFKKSTQCYFHNKATSLNVWVVSFLVSITGMIGIIYENITMFFNNTTLPITHNVIITQFEQKTKEVS